MEVESAVAVELAIDLRMRASCKESRECRSAAGFVAADTKREIPGKVCRSSWASRRMRSWVDRQDWKHRLGLAWPVGFVGNRRLRATMGELDGRMEA